MCRKICGERLLRIDWRERERCVRRVDGWCVMPPMLSLQPRRQAGASILVDFCSYIIYLFILLRLQLTSFGEGGAGAGVNRYFCCRAYLSFQRVMLKLPIRVVEHEDGCRLVGTLLFEYSYIELYAFLGGRTQSKPCKLRIHACVSRCFSKYVR